MIVWFLLFLLSVVFVEGATELVTKSLIFKPVREMLPVGSFVWQGIHCGHCTSVWMAMLPALTLALFTPFLPIYFFPMTTIFFVVVLQRLANYLHHFVDKFLDKYYDPRFRGITEEK
jgi:hypothetical protein